MPKKMTDLEKQLAKLRSLGIDVSDIKLPEAPIDTEDDTALEAEAALLYFDSHGRGFEHQTCPVCEQEFAYKYAYKMPAKKNKEGEIVSSGMRCSNRCRKKDLAARGIQWSPNLPLERRWASRQAKGALPLVVPPEALQAVQEAMSGESQDEYSE